MPEQYRCTNSGALIFRKTPAEKQLETLQKETTELKERLDKLETVTKKPRKKRGE